MALRSYRHHRFPPPIIQHAIWLYLRVTLSYVENHLPERGFRVEAAAMARLRCGDVGPDLSRQSTGGTPALPRRPPRGLAERRMALPNFTENFGRSEPAATYTDDQGEGRVRLVRRPIRGA